MALIFSLQVGDKIQHLVKNGVLTFGYCEEYTSQDTFWGEERGPYCKIDHKLKKLIRTFVSDTYTVYTQQQQRLLLSAHVQHHFLAT